MRAGPKAEGRKANAIAQPQNGGAGRTQRREEPLVSAEQQKAGPPGAPRGNGTPSADSPPDPATLRREAARPPPVTNLGRGCRCVQSAGHWQADAALAGGFCSLRGGSLPTALRPAAAPQNGGGSASGPRPARLRHRAAIGGGAWPRPPRIWVGGGEAGRGQSRGPL